MTRKFKATIISGVVAGALMAFSGSVSAESEIGGPFGLVDQTGKTVTDQDYAGLTKLVYFGYTKCKAFCPPTWMTLDGVLNDLGDDAENVRVLFIIIDPARDDTATLAEWQSNWHPNVVALRGTDDQIDAVAKNYRVMYRRAPKHMMMSMKPIVEANKKRFAGSDKIDINAKSDYMMDHAKDVFLMGGNGEFLNHFNNDTPPDVILSQVRKAVKGESQ